MARSVKKPSAEHGFVEFRVAIRVFEDADN
jgi:hypothetical protein